MRIALYVEDGLEQIVLTPEGDTEKAILAKMHDGSRRLSVHRNSFYHTQGGFVSQGPYSDKEFSTMIVLKKDERPKE